MADVPPIEFDHTSIVVLGNFNPAIFSIAWLQAQDLISSAQADTAVVDVITPDVALFHVGVIDVDIQRQRLQVATSDISESERARDLMLGILQTLNHTPVGAIGINRAVHIKVDSTDQYHKFGDMLMPKVFWDTFLRAPGMVNSTVRAVRPDDYVGYIQVSVEPSAMFSPAVFISHNDHYALRREKMLAGREDPNFLTQNQKIEPDTANVGICIEILESDWSNALERAHSAIEQVWRFATESVDE